MQTTVLSVDSTGRISADFTGGIVLHEASPVGPTPIDGVGWLDSGAVLQQLVYGNFDGVVHALIGEVAGDPFTIRDSDGNSDFLQQSDDPSLLHQDEAGRWPESASGEGALISWGVEVLFFENSVITNNERIEHNLGRSPGAIVFGSSDTNVTPAWDNPDGSTFGLSARRDNKVTGTVVVFWIAIG